MLQNSIYIYALLTKERASQPLVSNILADRGGTGKFQSFLIHCETWLEKTIYIYIYIIYIYMCCLVITWSSSMDQLISKLINNPVRGQLNRGNGHISVSVAAENLVS